LKTETPVRFAEWPLREELRAGLEELGIETPTPVQTGAFPLVLEGRDLLVQSRTGTGKTLAFGLPLLQRLAEQEAPRPRTPQVLVVLPTRELAIQVAGALGRMARPLGMEVATLFGGGFYRDQLRSLERGAPIVVGTPGRLCDHLERKSLDLSACMTLVLDEADEILDMGFAEELDQILAALPTERQSLLFSATMAPGTRALADKTLRDPQNLAISSGLTSAPEIAHVGYECFPDKKADALVNILHVDRPGLAIVFCHTKAETESLTDRLREEGFQSGHLNGDLPQAERTRVLNAFRRGHIEVLVATDVAARGIDVKGVSHVYNLGVPRDPETYIHRTGRTGRAGASGTAVTFVIPRDAPRFRRMLQNAGIKVDMKLLPQAADVRKKLREVFHEKLAERVERGPDADMLVLADELLAYIEPRDLVTALLEGDEAVKAALAAGVDLPQPRKPEPRVAQVAWDYGNKPGQAPGGPKAPRADRPDRPMKADNRPGRGPRPMTEGQQQDPDGGEQDGRRPPRKLSEHHEPGMQRIWLNQGKAHRLMPGRLVQMVCSASGLKGDAIGAIAIHPFFCFFDVREGDAARVVGLLNGMSANGKQLKANLVERAPN
jgi:ATP-dependent RNA helicase DeaD